MLETTGGGTDSSIRWCRHCYRHRQRGLALESGPPRQSRFLPQLARWCIFRSNSGRSLGGGQTGRRRISELIVVHESSLVEVAAHLSLVEAATPLPPVE